jgi:tetratricopeptide (TPR) repeat protein
MKFSRRLIFNEPTSSAPINFGNLRLGAVTVCLVVFSISGTWAQSPPSSCAGYSWCNNGAGRTYIAPQQPYVAPPPQPSAADIAREQAVQLNDRAVALEKTRNWPLVISLFEQALRLNPNNTTAARNLAHIRAVALSDKALAADNEGNYALAASLYEQALQFVPHDYPDYKTIADNLTRARAIQQTQQERRRQDEIAVANIHQATQSLADSFKTASPPPVGPDLDFLSAGSTPAGRIASGQGSSTENSAPNKGTGTALFGAKSSPANLDFIGIDMNRDVNKPVATKNTIDALGSATQSGVDAKRSAISEESAKAKSNCVFDQAACANFKPVDPSAVRAVSQSPGAAALSAHIPGPAKGDRQIQQSVAYYQKLDGLKIDTQAKLATIEQKIKNKEGDPNLLDAERSQLNFDLKQTDESQKAITKQIKEHLIAINTPWVEDPPPTPATGPAPAPRPNQ